MDDAYTLPGPLALSRSTVDRAAHLRGDPEWLARVWEDPSTKVLIVGDGRVAAEDGALCFITPEQAPEGERYLLGVEEGTVFTAVHLDGVFDHAPIVRSSNGRPAQRPSGSARPPVTHADAAVGAAATGAEKAHPGPGDDGTGDTDAGVTGITGLSLRDVGSALNDRDAGLAVHAIALANWHATHRHCPRCGTSTVVAEAGHVRRCPADRSEHYPRTDPAVIMLVVDEHERCLLGHQRRWP
ncbi:NAD(+) diphosphatase, partial [Phytoactinopolyspora endophytica]|uniref:NAD(+) diphosphatase n=1 Tax=Phytoactinopolyspora endophytica TaxID=1642495 RepID=UPI0023EA54A8